MNNAKLIKLLPVILVSASHAGLGTNVVEGLAGASEFMLGLFYLTGIAFVFTGVNKMKKLGHRTAFMNVDSGITGPLIMVFLGAMLIFFPSFLEVLSQSIWASPDIAELGDLAYADSDQSLLSKIGPMVTIIQFIGLIAILRGFLILTKVTGQGAQPGTISKGFIHIIGGVMAVHIVRTAEVMINTFGSGI